MKSKRYYKLPQNTKELKPDTIKNILSLIKSNCTTKFDESIDLNFRINNKQKKSEVNVRTVVNMPSGTGKSIRVAVVCEEEKNKEAQDANADLVGGDEFIERIKNGELNFDKLICTPSMMIKLSKLGKILGPKSLMPNPKLGTVTNDVTKAVNLAKAGQIEIRNDKDGNIGMSIGKQSFNDEMLIKNYNAVIDALEKEKSNLTIKGDLVKQVYISSSMGVSYKIKMDKSL